MTHPRQLNGALLVFLTVGCGVALQLFMIRNALMLAHVAAAFLTLAAHIAGWGLGLGLGRSGSSWVRHPAVTASAAAGLAWLGTALSTAAGPLVPAGLGMTGFALTALMSGTLTGLSIASALAACPSPMLALGADLSGVGLGALSHVLLTASFPQIPSPLPWIALLVVSAARKSVGASVWTALVGAVLFAPLDHPARLARADNPLAKALRNRGLQAWIGSFYDLDGRVDAVVNPKSGGMELFINAATQAQTPTPSRDRVTVGIMELLKPRSAVVLGAGGMADIATLLGEGVERVVAVERSGAVLRAARTVAPPARELFEDPRVEIVHGEARRFVTENPGRFDLVLLPLAYSRAGVAPATLMFLPSYLFTIEGIIAQGAATTDKGAVCFVLPSFKLRDRVLATLGEIERHRVRRASLPERLWVADNPRTTAYTNVVCWTPHAALPAGYLSSDLKNLHHPQWPVSAALLKRLNGVESLPPVWDQRPYFFDLSTPRSGLGGVPPSVARLFIWTPMSLLLMAITFSRRRKLRHGRSAPAAAHMVIAWLTGFAFPALEYVVLSVARGSGFSEGIAYASVAVTFAAAGMIGMVPLGSVRQRTVLGATAMLCIAVFFALGGMTWLFALRPALAALYGPMLMAASMTAGAASFAGLFRAERDRSSSPPDVRQLFLASALGTLAAVAPVLLVELRWGGPGCALTAAVAYALAFGVTVIAPPPRTDDPR
jgi:hypothetical protein